VKNKIPFWLVSSIIGAIYGIFVSFFPIPLAFLTYPLWIILLNFTIGFIGISWGEPGICKIPLFCKIPLVVYSVIFYALIGILISFLIKKIAKVRKKTLGIFLFLIMYFSIFNSVYAENTEIPSVIVNLDILSEIRKPVSYSGIVEIINTEQVKSIKLNKLLIYKSEKILYEKDIDKNLIGVKNEYETFQNLSRISYQEKVNMNLTELYNKLFQGIHIEKIIINPNEIFENGQYEPGSESNIKIIIELIDENKKYLIEKDLLIKLLDPLPKGSLDFSQNKISGNKITPFSVPVGPTGWYYGDLHLHSGYSSINGYDNNFWTPGDNCGLETTSPFGNTIPDLKSVAEALDLNWFSITDHSYCLDPIKWNNVVSECDDVTNSNFLCLPSEEISVSEDCPKGILPDEGCGSAAHLGAHDISSFINQSGGTFPWEFWCPNSPGTQQGINLINNQGGFSIINHPSADAWDCESIDCINNETGLEIWNGKWEDNLLELHTPHNQNTLNTWVSLLLKGKKIFAFGGTDYHRNASDAVYNGVYLQDFNKEGLKDALKNGRSFVSNNGFLSFEIKGPSDIDGKKLGNELDINSGETITISIYYDVFDTCDLKLKKGYIDSTEIIKNDFGNIIESGTLTFYDSHTFQDGYYRLECVKEENNKRIYTNPIWFNINEISTTTTTSTASTTTISGGGGGGGATIGGFYLYDQEIDITNSSDTKIGYVTPYKITLVTDFAYLKWMRDGFPEGNTWPVFLVKDTTIPLPFGFENYLTVRINNINSTGVNLTIKNINTNDTVDQISQRIGKFVSRGYYSSLHVVNENDTISKNLNQKIVKSEAVLAESVSDNVVKILLKGFVISITGLPIDIPDIPIDLIYNFIIDLINKISPTARNELTAFLLNIQTHYDNSYSNDTELNNKGIFTVYVGNPEKNKLSDEFNEQLKQLDLPHFEKENDNWVIKSNRTYYGESIGLIAAIPEEKSWNVNTLYDRWDADKVRLYKVLIAGIGDKGINASTIWYTDQLKNANNWMALFITAFGDYLKDDVDAERLMNYTYTLVAEDLKTNIGTGTIMYGWVLAATSSLNFSEIKPIDSLGYVIVVENNGKDYTVLETDSIVGDKINVFLEEYTTTSTTSTSSSTSTSTTTSTTSSTTTTTSTTTTIDSTPPIITINNPLNSSILYDNSILLNVTTNENSTCEYNIDSGNYHEFLIKEKVKRGVADDIPIGKALAELGYLDYSYTKDEIPTLQEDSVNFGGCKPGSNTSISINVGDSVDIFGKSLTLLNVGYYGHALVDIDGKIANLYPMGSNIVNGLLIMIDDYFYSDTFRAATLKICEQEDINIHDAIYLRRDSPYICSSLNCSDDEYKTGIYMEAGTGALRYYYIFDEAINVSKVTSAQPLTINFLGKKIKITSIYSATKFTAYIGDTYSMYIGDCVEVENKRVCLQNVGSAGSVILNINGTDYIVSGIQTKEGIEITVDDYFYSDDSSEMLAILIMGNQSVGSYQNGDKYKKVDNNCTDNPNDTDCWEWIISGLTTNTATMGDPPSSGPIIGIQSAWVINDDKDNPITVDGCYKFPNDYAEICMDSLTVPDDSYENIKFKIVDGINFASCKAGDTSVQGLLIESSVNDGLQIESDAWSGITSDVRTEKIWMAHNDTGKIYAMYIATDGTKRCAGNHKVSGASTNTIARVYYDETKDDNVEFDINGTFNTQNNINITIDIHGKTTTDLPSQFDDLFIRLGHTSEGTFTKMGSTANTEEANELQWCNPKGSCTARTANIAIGTKDEDHRTMYGIIVENTKIHGASDEVSIKIPSEQVFAHVSVGTPTQWYFLQTIADFNEGKHTFNVKCSDPSNNEDTESVLFSYECLPNWTLNNTWGECLLGGIQYKNYYDTKNCNKPDTKPLNINQTCVHYKELFNTTANQTKSIDAYNETDTILEFVTTSNILGTSINLTKYSDNPGNANVGVLELGKYIEIGCDEEMEDNLGWIMIKMYYNPQDVSNAGIDESTLRMHYYNESASKWEVMQNSGVDTTANYVWGNTTHLSFFGLFGNAPTSPTVTTTTPITAAGGGGGGGGGGGTTTVITTIKPTTTTIKAVSPTTKATTTTITAGVGIPTGRAAIPTGEFLLTNKNVLIPVLSVLIIGSVIVVQFKVVKPRSKIKYQYKH